MTKLTTQFYECDNPECRLRFPGSQGHPRGNRCPICRSSTQVVASAASLTERTENTGARNQGHMVVILDNIRSAWNVGSIFRTADGTGIRKLYLCGITPTPDNPKVRKTALGVEVSLPWEKANNAILLSRQLISNGTLLWALEDMPGAEQLFHIDVELPAAKIALVIGNEVSGIDPGVLELCDKVIAIPMLGKKQSYNVAVAFGIAASFFLYRQSVAQGSRIILPSN